MRRLLRRWRRRSAKVPVRIQAWHGDSQQGVAVQPVWRLSPMASSPAEGGATAGGAITRAALWRGDKR